MTDLASATAAHVSPQLTESASPAKKLLSPLTILPGLAVWGLIGVGIAKENQSLISAGVAVLVASIVVRLVVSARSSSATRAEEARVWFEGTPAVARVLRISTNGGMNNHPRVSFELEVTPKTGAPYRATTSVIVDRLAIPRIQPGAEMAVRIDPREPTRVAIDESLTYLGYRR